MTAVVNAPSGGSPPCDSDSAPTDMTTAHERLRASADMYTSVLHLLRGLKLRREGGGRNTLK